MEQEYFDSAKDDSSVGLSGFGSKSLTLFTCNRLSEKGAKELYSFGYGLYQQKRYHEAVETFLYLVLYSRPDAKTFMGLGACHQSLNEFEKATHFYQFSILLGFGDPAVYLHFGECLLRLNRKSEAVVQFNMAASLTDGLKDQVDLFNRALELSSMAERTEHTS